MSEELRATLWVLFVVVAIVGVASIAVFLGPGESLCDLGYPTRAELASVGLTGDQFFDRYIGPHARLQGVRHPQIFASLVLADFHRDYPELAPKTDGEVRS